MRPMCRGRRDAAAGDPRVTPLGGHLEMAIFCVSSTSVTPDPPLL
jgi:hypothetical protein